MRDGLRPGVRGRAVRADRVARRRLPPVRDRSLHRRPRLVRRAVGEQLPLRPPQAARAGRRLRRGLLDAPAAATRTSTSTSGSASAPDVHVVTILGEGSFHQVHGGTTTNQADPAERRERVFGVRRAAYAELRGRTFNGPEQGRSTSSAASRTDAGEAVTRPRRMTAWTFAGRSRDRGRLDGPTPLAGPRRDPRRLHRRVLAERRWPSDTTWLGQPRPEHADRPRSRTRRSSTRCGPTGSSRPAPATAAGRYFLASVCDLLDHGQVVSVGNGADKNLPEHPRVTYIVGKSTDDGDRRPGPCARR